MRRGSVWELPNQFAMVCSLTLAHGRLLDREESVYEPNSSHSYQTLQSSTMTTKHLSVNEALCSWRRQLRHPEPTVDGARLLWSMHVAGLLLDFYDVQVALPWILYDVDVWRRANIRIIMTDGASLLDPAERRQALVASEGAGLQSGRAPPFAGESRSRGDSALGESPSPPLTMATGCPASRLARCASTPSSKLQDMLPRDTAIWNVVSDVRIDPSLESAKPHGAEARGAAAAVRRAGLHDGAAAALSGCDFAPLKSLGIGHRMNHAPLQSLEIGYRIDLALRGTAIGCRYGRRPEHATPVIAMRGLMLTGPLDGGMEEATACLPAILSDGSAGSVLWGLTVR